MENLPSGSFCVDQRGINDFSHERQSVWDIRNMSQNQIGLGVVDNQQSTFYEQRNAGNGNSSDSRERQRDRERRRERDRDRDRGRERNRFSKDRDRSQIRHTAIDGDDYHGCEDSRSSYSDSNSYDNNYEYGSNDDYSYKSNYYDDDYQDRSSYSDRRGSSSNSSYEKDRHRDRNDRDRDRGRDRDRDRDRDRSRDRERSDRDRGSWKEEIPNNTIMLRGLAQHITETDIRSELLACNLEAKDIRLMRKKDTGASRGFAFVEFQNLSEAVRWMELKQGVLTFQGQFRGTMHYSIPKEGGPHDRSGVVKADWNCTKCGAHNFKRRDFCFKCNTSREEADQIRLGEGYDEVSNTPCNTLLFRNLDTLTTEEKILAALQELTALPIKNIRIAKDSLTNTSRGFCYVELNSTNEAVQLNDQLTNLGTPLLVDGKQVSLSYAKQSLSSLVSASSASVASTAVAAAQWTNQAPSETGYGSGNQAYAQQYSGDNSSGYGDYQQQNYNQTYNQNYNNYEKGSYDQYYQYNYGTETATASTENTTKTDATSSSLDGSSMVLDEKFDMSGKFSQPSAVSGGSSKSAAIISRDAISQEQDTSNTEYPKYPVPDVSTYQYDEASAYYYDPSTGLYYDPNSQYYYNAEYQHFLYWDGEKETYLLASSANMEDVINSQEKKTKEKDKQDKVKIAKKIVKDMEKWAKTLNQKKEIAKHGIVVNPFSISDRSKQSATADAGFAMLEKKASLAERQQAVFEVMKKKEIEDKKLMPPPSLGKKEKAGGLVAAYGSGSDSDDDDEDGSQRHELQLTDWNKMACLLCKRQFPSKEALLRHQQLSDLHKQNLETLSVSKQMSVTEMEDLERKEREGKYRDRAKERREKYGEPDPPHPNKLKEKYLKQRSISYEEPTKKGIGSDNIGNKMLKAMGWTEGQGLGKANQGRVEIVEAQRRSATAGLGMRGGTYGAAAGDSYKDTVKKMTQARFNELP